MTEQSSSDGADAPIVLSGFNYRRSWPSGRTGMSTWDEHKAGSSIESGAGDGGGEDEGAKPAEEGGKANRNGMSNIKDINDGDERQRGGQRRKHRVGDGWDLKAKSTNRKVRRRNCFKPGRNCEI